MKDEEQNQSNIDSGDESNDGNGNDGKTNGELQQNTLLFKLPAGPGPKKFSSDYQPSPDAKSHGWWKKRKGRLLFQAIMQLPANGSNWVTDPKTGESHDQLARVRKQAAVYFNMPESLVTVEMLAFMKQVAVAIQRNDTHSTFAFNTVMDQSYGRPKPMEQFEEIEKPAINIYLGPQKTDDAMGDDTKPMDNAMDDIPPIANSEEDIQ